MNGHAQIEAVITNQGSVKKGDELPYVGNGYLSINIVPDTLFRSHLPPALPLTLWERDRLLLSTVRHESFWRAAVNIATAKFATMGWEIESDMPTLRKRFQQLILNAEGVKQIGWTRFCRAFVPSFLCTKGAVVEIARETHSMGSRIVGLHHLDPLRCLFTNDAEIPVLYQSLYDSKWHELKWWQVGIFSDMPDVMELSGGAGVCAAEGAYQQIRKLAAIEQYIVDKVTGRRPLALQIVSGMSDRQIRDAVDSGKADAERKGWVQFMGALVVTAPNPDVNLVTVPLAELPDGFDRKQEFDIALLSYADNVGLDPQDLQPLTGQALGTGAQSQVLDEKSKGRGLKLLAEDLGKWFNEFVLPEKVQFAWYSKDLRDEGQQADNMVKRGTWLQGLIDKGIIDAGQATNILVDYGDLPADYLVTDVTQTGDIADDEKPELAEGQPALQPVLSNGQPTTPQRRTAFTPSQTQGIVNIVSQAKRGDLGRGQAIQLLKTAYSLTEQEATDLLDADNPKAEVEDIEETAAAGDGKQEKATRKPTKEQKERAGNLIDEEMKRATRLYKEVA